MELIIGNTYIVEGLISGHDFDIGQEVEYFGKQNDGTHEFHSLNGDKVQWLNPKDVESKTARTELQKTVDTLEQSIAKLKELIK